MKKYICFFIFLSVTAIIYLFSVRPRHDLISTGENKFTKNDFVSIGEHNFRLHDKDFFSLAVNYIATLQTDGKEMWSRPGLDYTVDSVRENTTKENCLKELRADMQLIRQMGFNTVRIVGITELSIVNDSDKFSDLMIRVYTGKNRWINPLLCDTDGYKKYFDAISGMLNEINAAGLKAILTLRTRPDVTTTELFLKRITKYFRNDATIMAYDLFNEPLYFDKPERNKMDVHEITSRWKKIVNENAPSQLMTIGLEGIREVHEWDPATVEADFISFHPYEHEPEQVRNELAWYNRFVKRPWMIGETAIPADDDSVKYETQKLFAEKTLTQAHNCGAWGYSWWQYKDVHWQKYHSSFMGMINWKGETHLPEDSLVVYGTVKPVAEVFQKYNPSTPKGECICLSNYYNYSEGRDCRIKGKLVDSNNKPVEGGIVLAWNEWWSSSYHTITKEDGSFEVRGTFLFYHWIASANAYSMVRGNVMPDTAKKDVDGIPTMNLGTLKIKKLPFAN